MNLQERVLQLSGIQINETRKASEVPPTKEPVNNETHIHAKEFFDKIENKIDSLMDQGQKTVSVTSAYASKPDFFADLKKLLDGKYEGFEFDVKQIESGDGNKTKESLEISWEKKKLTEGFETHVLCSECGSGDLELSKLKTKIRCTKCGNVGLTESILGLEEGKSMKLGGGGRFAKVEAAARKGGASNPAAVAAAVGRKKYGKKKFQTLAAKGKKRASKNKMENC